MPEGLPSAPESQDPTTVYTSDMGVVRSVDVVSDKDKETYTFILNNGHPGLVRFHGSIIGTVQGDHVLGNPGQGSRAAGATEAYKEALAKNLFAPPKQTPHLQNDTSGDATLNADHQSPVKAPLPSITRGDDGYIHTHFQDYPAQGQSTDYTLAVLPNGSPISFRMTIDDPKTGSTTTIVGRVANGKSYIGDISGSNPSDYILNVLQTASDASIQYNDQNPTTGSGRRNYTGLQPPIAIDNGAGVVPVVPVQPDGTTQTSINSFHIHKQNSGGWTSDFDATIDANGNTHIEGTKVFAGDPSQNYQARGLVNRFAVTVDPNGNTVLESATTTEPVMPLLKNQTLTAKTPMQPLEDIRGDAKVVDTITADSTVTLQAVQNYRQDPHHNVQGQNFLPQTVSNATDGLTRPPDGSLQFADKSGWTVKDSFDGNKFHEVATHGKDSVVMDGVYNKDGTFRITNLKIDEDATGTHRTFNEREIMQRYLGQVTDSEACIKYIDGAVATSNRAIGIHLRDTGVQPAPPAVNGTPQGAAPANGAQDETKIYHGERDSRSGLLIDRPDLNDTVVRLADQTFQSGLKDQGFSRTLGEHTLNRDMKTGSAAPSASGVVPFVHDGHSYKIAVKNGVPLSISEGEGANKTVGIITMESGKPVINFEQIAGAGGRAVRVYSMTQTDHADEIKTASAQASAAVGQYLKDHPIPAAKATPPARPKTAVAP